MKRDDVIRVARDAGFIDTLMPEESNDGLGGVWVHGMDIYEELERAFKAVHAASAAAEREECAKLCEERAEQSRIEQESHEYPWKGGK